MPLKIVGTARLAYHPDDRQRILSGPCPVCLGGPTRTIAQETFCDDCLTAFVEDADLNPAESARRERYRFANAHRK